MRKRAESMHSMAEAYSLDSDRSDVSIGSDTRSSPLSLQHSESSFEDSSLGELDPESGSRIEPYLYEPEDSEEESSVVGSGGTDGEDDDVAREWLDNTGWQVWIIAFDKK